VQIFSLPTGGAAGLPRADTFGSSDPYVLAYLGDEEVHRTKVIRNNLNPDWKDEFFLVRIPEDTSIPELRLEVWDYDRIGSGDLLGTAKVPVSDLVDPPRLEQTLALQAAAEEGGKAAGTLRVNIRSGAKVGTRSEELVLKAGATDEKVEVQIGILAASGLARADSFGGKSDPFCLAYWNNQQVHKTRVINNTTDAVWKEEAFTIPLHPDGSGGRLVVEVWDADMLQKGDFLGQVSLRSSDILFPPASRMTLGLERKASLSAKQNQFVQGTITLNFHCTKSVDVDPFVARKPDPPMPLSQEPPKLVEMALDLTAERSRWEEDGLTLPSIVDQVTELAKRLDEEKELDMGGDMISEVNAGQMLDIWLRQQSYAVIPGVPSKAVVPFHGRGAGNTGGFADQGRGPFEMGEQFALVVSCQEMSQADQDYLRSVAAATGDALYAMDQRKHRASRRGRILTGIKGFCSRVLEESRAGATATPTAGGTLCLAEVAAYALGVAAAGLPPSWEIVLYLARPFEDELVVLASSVAGAGIVGQGVRRGQSVAFDCLDRDAVLLVADGQAHTGHCSWEQLQPSRMVASGPADGVDLWRWFGGPLSQDEINGGRRAMELEIHIISARGLASADLFGKSDPFCEVYAGGVIAHRTAVISNNLNPDWTEERCFLPVLGTTPVPEVTIQVWDSDAFTKGDFLGKVDLDVAHMCTDPTRKQWTLDLDLAPRPNVAARKNKYVKGSLQLVVTRRSDSGTQFENQPWTAQDFVQYQVTDKAKTDFALVPLMAGGLAIGCLGVRMRSSSDMQLQDLARPSEELKAGGQQESTGPTEANGQGGLGAVDAVDPADHLGHPSDEPQGEGRPESEGVSQEEASDAVQDAEPPNTEPANSRTGSEPPTPRAGALHFNPLTAFSRQPDALRSWLEQEGQAMPPWAVPHPDHDPMDGPLKLSWEELAQWASSQGMEGMPSRATYTDMDALPFLTDIGQVLGPALDASRKQNCLQLFSEAPLPSDPRVLLQMAADMVHSSFPRVRQVDMWELARVAIPSPDKDTPPTYTMVLRSILSAGEEGEEETGIGAGAEQKEQQRKTQQQQGPGFGGVDFAPEKLDQLPGKLQWPQAALTGLAKLWAAKASAGSKRSAFRTSGGQLVIPYHDHTGGRPASAVGASASGGGHPTAQSTAPQLLHALVVRGDPRAPWDNDPEALIRVTIELEARLAEVRNLRSRQVQESG